MESSVETKNILKVGPKGILQKSLYYCLNNKKLLYYLMRHVH